ncbi:hypothetical protein HGH93_29885 [Chitinophaga polysaccharea]|uniref:hypothetical protein n=1 Tax=Chitinophaga polysaccharea TaxID=1293035 RepID=UPI0014552E14|nr:hypothetical protein [Chitinophaga polysaccharea]NLR62340.1 hypothetical protein [Chitinophaga polysaccharea]
MKMIFLYIVLTFASLSCKSGKKPTNAEVGEKHEQFDSLQANNLDQLEAKDSSFYLKASKGKEGEICLRYRLNHTNADKDFCFKYFDYSDVVFPDTSVGVMNGSSFRESSYYLVHDSILILPLIGMNNFLSVYVLNLQSQQVLGSDIRTSFGLVWIDEKSSTFLTTDTPEYINDTTYLYKLNKYKIEGKELSLIKTDTAHLNIDLKDNLKANYRIARRLLH